MPLEAGTQLPKNYDGVLIFPILRSGAFLGPNTRGITVGAMRHSTVAVVAATTAVPVIVRASRRLRSMVLSSPELRGNATNPNEVAAGSTREENDTANA